MKLLIRTLFIWLFVVISTVASAQKPDTGIAALIARCDSLKAGGFGSAATILNRNQELKVSAFKGLSLTPQGDPLDSARFLSYIAYSYSHGMELNPDSIQYYYRLALDKALAASHTPLIASITGSLLHIELQMGRPDKADEYKRDLQSILDSTSNSTILRDGYATLGSYYQHKAYYSTAQDYYLKSIAIRKRGLDTLSDAQSRIEYSTQCYQLAKLYMNTDMPDRSIAFLNEAARFKGLVGVNDYRVVSAYVDAFCRLGKIDSALAYLHGRVDSLEKRLQGRVGGMAEVVMPNLNIARYYLDHGQPQQAWPYIDKCDTMNRGKGISFLTYEIQRLQGKYFLAAGQPAKAIPILHAALPVANLMSRENYTDIVKDLAQAYKATGNNSQAVSYYEQHVRSLDSLTTEKISRTFADQETRYQTAEKEEQIVSLDKDNRLHVLELKNARHARLLLVAGLVIMGAFSLILYFVYRNKAALNRELALANNTKARLFGIISHDLRAPVSSIIQLLTIQKERPELLEPAARLQHEEKIRTASNNVLGTMEDLLFWSKSQMAAFTPNPVAVNIAAALRKETALLPDPSSVHITIPETLTRDTDADFLAVILRNLLQNAVRYRDADSPIAVVADHDSIRISNLAAKADPAMLNGSTPGRTNGLGLQIARDLAVPIGAVIGFTKEGSTLVATLRWKS